MLRRQLKLDVPSDSDSSSDEGDSVDERRSSTGSYRPAPPMSGSASQASHSVMSTRTALDIAAASLAPIKRIDYSMPKIGRGRPAPDATHRRNSTADKFFTTREGSTLLREDALYANQTRKVLQRVTSLRDKRMLVLGCGASRKLLTFLLLGLQRVIFVDPDRAALERLQALVEEAGYDDHNSIEYVEDGAFEYLARASAKYDVVLMVKCVGLVLRNGKRVTDLFDLLAHSIDYDGVLLIDHHMAFAGLTGVIGDICAPGDYDRATICGRYADEVAYSVDVSHAEFDRLLSWTPHTNPVQGWQQYVYRKIGGRPDVGHPRDAQPILPVTTLVVAPQERDDTADALIPPSTRGCKRVPCASDAGKFSYADVAPKFDGHGGVMTVYRTAAVFTSALFRFSIALPKLFNSALHLSAELVHADGDHARECVVVVTGLCGLGDTPMDAQSARGLALARRLLAGLHTCGILVNGPGWLAKMDFDTGHVVVPVGERSGGGHMRLPADGFNCALNGSFGHFYKIGSRWSVDVDADDGAAVIGKARAWLGRPGGVMIVETTGSAGGVAEFVPVDGRCVQWARTRPRPDKKFGSAGGTLLVDIAAAYNAWTLYGDNYGKMLRFLTGISS